MKTVALLALVLLPSVATAQQAGPFYIAGGIVVPYQEGVTGEEPQTYNSASGGWTLGFSAAAGVFITPRVAIEGEWARTGWMTSTQSSRYDMTFHDRRRDQFVSIVGRFPLSSGSVRVEPVGGMVFTLPEASTQVDRLLFTGFYFLTSEPTIVHDLDTHIGFTVGCDVRIGNDRIAVVPSFRFSDTGITSGRYSDDQSVDFTREIGSIYPGGWPHWTYRAGAALRINF